MFFYTPQETKGEEEELRELLKCMCYLCRYKSPSASGVEGGCCCCPDVPIVKSPKCYDVHGTVVPLDRGVRSALGGRGRVGLHPTEVAREQDYPRKNGGIP